MVDPEHLTDEQQAVVRHGSGPAVVLAVPGAGKTTTLVHRVRHLVQERKVDPDRILLCSFGRDTAQDLRSALHAHGLRGVDVRTLHSVGYALLRRADERPAPTDPDDAGHQLARRTLRAFAAEQTLDRSDLDISPSDLLDRIAAWKQQLVYADLDAADLPAEARSRARQADPDNETYLSLYRRFETRRRQNGILTYADMLRDGWERLVGDEALRDQAQTAYEHVLVDEFQDLSRAQFEILDLLTASHRNYVAVGDDDQCIYGWRGASPSFLRGFADRYGADEYRIQASFRLPAAPITLANSVIQHNESRSPKQIRLTRGFEGASHFFEADTPAAEAAMIADTVQRLHAEQHRRLDEMVVLVRTYGQTPPLEQALLERNLSYRVHGHSPFYRRPEVQTLLRYLYWGLLERRQRTDGWFEHSSRARKYAERFAQIVNNPNRYVARGRLDRITQEALRHRTSVLDVMADHAPKMHDRTTERVESFLETAEALVARIDAPAHATLDWLVEAIDYEAALREQSAFRDRGETRVRTVRALLRHAESHETAAALLRDIKSLADAPAPNDADAALDLRSIHRAKGREWPVVFVPGCTEDTLPLRRSTEASTDLSEERRLFYVAITRTRDRLYLSTPDPDSPSRFLEEADARTCLPLSRHVQTALTTDPSKLSDEEAARLCGGIVELGVEPYIQRRWSPAPSRAAALRERLDTLNASIEAAVETINAYQRAQEQYDTDKQEARSDVQAEVDRLRETLGAVSFSATHEAPDPVCPDDATVRFDWTEAETHIAVYWQDTRVGTIDPLSAGRLDAQTVMSLPWPHLVGRFSGGRRGRRQLQLTIDWDATAATWSAEAVEALSPPSPPDDRTRLLAREAVRTGCSLLRRRLSALASEDSA